VLVGRLGKGVGEWRHRASHYLSREWGVNILLTFFGSSEPLLEARHHISSQHTSQRQVRFVGGIHETTATTERRDSPPTIALR